jgi:hypothetical protein
VRTIDPFKVIVALVRYRADHGAADVVTFHPFVYGSSPKYHAHPVGEFVEASAQVTESGERPTVGLQEKDALGGSTALTGNISTPQSRIASRNSLT